MVIITPQTSIVALDLETTGLSPSWDAIVEVAAVCWQGGRETGHFQSLVNPERLIPREAMAVHGITDAMVREQPTIREILPAFLAFCEVDVVVAHNAKFDASFLRAACTRTGLTPLSAPVLDSCALARRSLPGHRSYSLEALKAELRLGEAGVAHRALQDARDCLALFLRCVETGEPLMPDPGKITPPESFPLIHEAIAGGQTVMIEYRDGRGRTTHREIRPLAVDIASIEAHCMLRNDTRHFQIDRIRRVWRPSGGGMSVIITKTMRMFHRDFRDSGD